MQRTELDSYLGQLLRVGDFHDYCPNGLQVEGRAEVHRILAGVSASQALLDTAVEWGADAVLVHHGWFWRGEDGRVTGLRRRRLATLIKHDINLFAYHLPLDAHPELGNNAQLARLLGWTVSGRFGEQDIAFLGEPGEVVSAAQMAATVARALGRVPLLVGDGARQVHRLAWCSGGGQGYFEQAIAAGVDLFVSGEISEQTTHLARESGVPFLAAGHHATERYGARALAEHLARHFNLNCRFMDIDNPA
ncbi:MAG: Nif3-like dinuclear metal center hexameric protein [Rhodocyclaceae bacterium]|nr:Nif3-like dinuclear metal center hexameric protein [Rhodocyclaceae bacterium]